MPGKFSSQQSAAKGNEGAMLQYMSDVEDALSSLADATGIDLTSTDASAVLKAPPLGVTWTVVGIDGKFQIRITNPQPGVNRDAGALNSAAPGDFYASDPRTGRDVELVNPAGQLKTIVHEIQSATSLNFDADANVTTYGPGEALSYDIQDPNVTKFWRVRSRFSDSDYGDWVYYTSPATCGPVGVWSGLLRAFSAVPVNSQVGYATSGILSQPNTAVTTIQIASTTGNFGSGNVVYNSGSVTPAGYGKQYIYADDPKYAGGAVVYQASTSPSVLSAAEGRVYFGTITTVNGGASPPPSGGGGCVEVGVPVYFPPGTEDEVIETIESCDEWIIATLKGDTESVPMHPDTLVSVFKRARDLQTNDRIEGMGGSWRELQAAIYQRRASMKVRRTVPGGVYNAGTRGQYRMHNQKDAPA